MHARRFVERRAGSGIVTVGADAATGVKSIGQSVQLRQLHKRVINQTMAHRLNPPRIELVCIEFDQRLGMCPPDCIFGHYGIHSTFPLCSGFRKRIAPLYAASSVGQTMTPSHVTIRGNARGDMTLDFSQLYADLGLHPDCSLDQYKRAYRQRLSELHPDHAPSSETRTGLLPLQDLIALHTSAMQFHREHGRLPGSALPAGVTPAAPPLRSGPPYAAQPESIIERRSTLTRWLLASLLLLGTVLAGVSMQQAQPPSALPATNPAPLATVSEPPTPTPDGPLELGMDAETVRAIQGEPMRIDQDTWEYGPSWLRIEHNQLVDWYSSPFYRLKTRTPSPAGGADTAEKYGR